MLDKGKTNLYLSTPEKNKENKKDLSTPRDFCPQEPPYFESFFQISRRFKNVEKKEQIQIPCTSANAED